MRFLIPLVLILGSTACIHNVPYRAKATPIYPASHSCTDTGNVSLERGSWTLPAGTQDVSRKGYKLGFVEFDDFGEFYNRCELNGVVQTIQEAKRAGSGSAVVIVFVHGWKNNASEQSGNVWGFRDALTDIARRSNGIPANVPVVGIYLGWRGDVLKFGKNLTFWDRRDTATHVGGAHMTETLLEIIQETKGPHYRDPSLCVLVGHSFGGLLLEHALTETLINVLEREAYEAYEQPDCKTAIFNPPVDLITFINEAAPAIEAKKTLEYLAAHDIQIMRDNKQYPLLVSMTSQTDLATKLALPGGQALSLPFNSLRTYTQPDQFGITNQRSYYLQSTANMTALQSHVVGNAEDEEIARAYRADKSAQFAEVPIDGERYRILRIAGAKNNTAYWVMQIPTSIVPDHGTIFRPEFRALLQAFLPPVPKRTSTRSCVDQLGPGPQNGGQPPQLYFTRTRAQ